MMLRAKMVVCRSGYSTIMDLKATKSKALLVPTPGQPEQEYLAANLLDKGIFFSVDQVKLNLTKDLSVAETYSGFKYI
jgi:predicted glycosyltransferase